MRYFNRLLANWLSGFDRLGFNGQYVYHRNGTCVQEPGVKFSVCYRALLFPDMNYYSNSGTERPELPHFVQQVMKLCTGFS